ncbi:hypothetical protein EST38_g6214 [Candolleomyces aberdarensis]|uniref:TLC domain-containing protein n=1 Tax=Candolleomyces aberdarensis TaxID=2316362 RepID=A0A4Q2DIK8_9AGAR|nr:hypothetical protein EST38_g6214 [Candolleomyces aberdarensis]
MSPPFLDRFLAEILGLSKLPPYLPTLYLSLAGFTFVHLVLAPWLSAKLAPDAWGALRGKRARNNWCSLTLFFCRYFIWDTFDAIINFVDAGFVIHGVACTLIYAMSFRPFVAYYGTRCLLWEISTFFLNIHWFLDKTNRTGSNLQLINGIALLFTFFSVRLVYGGSISYQFFLTLLGAWRSVPWSYTFTFGLANFALQGLNWLWFSKMIAAIRKRFGGDERKQLIPEHHTPVPTESPSP